MTLTRGVAALATVGLLLVLPIVRTAAAHDIQHTEDLGTAMVIRMHYADGSPFAFESYEVYRDGDKVPQQVGRTDKGGRIAFLPDGPATWRVKAYTEDGHGLDIRIEGGADGTVTAADQPMFDRFTGIIVGIAVILGLFGILMRVSKRPSA